MSLRLKISALSALLSGAILFGFGLASWYLIYRERLAAVDREIRTLAARHPGWLANRPNYDRLTRLLEFTFGSQQKENVILLIQNEGGTIHYRSPHWPADLDAAKLDLSFQDKANTPVPGDGTVALPEPPHRGPPWASGPGIAAQRIGRGFGWGQGGGAPFTKVPRFITTRSAETSWRIGMFGNGQTTLVLGLNLSDVHRELNRLRDAFLLALPLSLLLVALGGWTIAGRALRPLKSIADTAERVTARGLDQRIPLEGSDKEVVRVVLVLNGMMDRLEKSFGQANRFTADASHELKTPLAIMQGELENALQRAETGSREQQVFSGLLEETQRLKNITRNLLFLAQADSGQLRLAAEEICLSDLLENATDDTHILAEPLELAFESQIEPELRVRADPHLLGTAVHNLLGNAVKYNEPRGRIVLRATRHGDGIQLLIGNSGTGIAEPDQAHVFDRFFRGRQTGNHTTEGAGLGLSLAREIVRAHGGEITLQESRPGWTAFCMSLPLSS